MIYFYLFFSLKLKYLSWPGKSVSVITYCINTICPLMTIDITMDSQSLFAIVKSLREGFLIAFYSFFFAVSQGYLFTELCLISRSSVNVTSFHTGDSFSFSVTVCRCLVTSLLRTQHNRDASDLFTSLLFFSLVGD